MQWLFDIVIAQMEAAGFLKTCFVDRGDPPIEDFVLVDFIRDSTWREFDLSAIVPAGASAVAMRVLFFNTIVGIHASFQTHGNVNNTNNSLINNLVANVVIVQDIVVPLDSDRKLDYWVDPGGWILLTVTVKGWWL